MKNIAFRKAATTPTDPFLLLVCPHPEDLDGLLFIEDLADQLGQNIDPA
jgi:hypothetical protein